MLLLALATILADPPALTGPMWLGPPVAGAQRIVSLAPSATELLFALGAGERVVGVTKFDDFPPEVRSRTMVGGFVDPDLEAVLALRPDVVVAIPTSGGRRAVDSLARLGVSVLILPANRFADLAGDIDALGALVGRQAEAQALRERLAKEHRELTGKRRAPRRVLVLVEARPLVAAGATSLLGELVAMLGGTPVVERGGAYPVLDLEAIAALRPEVIVETSMGSGRDSTLAEQLRRIGVRAPLVELRHDGLLRLGPRTLEGMRALAGAIWPEAQEAR